MCTFDEFINLKYLSTSDKVVKNIVSNKKVLCWCQTLNGIIPLIGWFDKSDTNDYGWHFDNDKEQVFIVYGWVELVPPYECIKEYKNLGKDYQINLEIPSKQPI